MDEPDRQQFRSRKQEQGGQRHSDERAPPDDVGVDQVCCGNDSGSADQRSGEQCGDRRGHTLGPEDVVTYRRSHWARHAGRVAGQRRHCGLEVEDHRACCPADQERGDDGYAPDGSGAEGGNQQNSGFADPGDG
jgi:hypothetical protein